MKRSQQVIIGIGFLVVAAMCIVPPFRFYRSSEYLPVWANTVGRLDITRLCLQIGAVAILTGGLVLLAKGKWKQGQSFPWGELSTTAMIVALIVVLIVVTWFTWKGKAEPNRSLAFADLSKVKLESLEIREHGISKYLKCRIYNGTDRAVNKLQVTLYISKTSEPIGRVGADGRRYLTEDEAFGRSPRIKLQMVESELFAPSAELAREYKQDFSTIGTVPPNSWSEGSILLSNCPEVEDRARWLVLLKAAKWEEGSN